MFRSVSSRSHPTHGGYEKLMDEAAAVNNLPAEEMKLKRFPFLQSWLTTARDKTKTPAAKDDTIHYKSKAKCHPLINLFHGRSNNNKKKLKKKNTTTAGPEYSRYLQYVKEGGLWDVHSNSPVLYYR